MVKWSFGAAALLGVALAMAVPVFAADSGAAAAQQEAARRYHLAVTGMT